MRTLNIAAAQMDANPAPTAERLARAEKLVAEAARAGAHLVVLPELFNTGYAYSDENHARAERFDGQTAAWMRDVTARLGVHLAGSLMLLEQGDIYNALLLFAPDGRVWRYDKNYPWGWERGYFRGPHGGPHGGPRGGRRVVVAETDLGDFGLLICWDVAHLDLWQQYAGRVDMMVICSCPPDVGDPTFCFPDGDRVTLDDLGPLAAFKGSGREMFGPMLNRQTAWLGVPAVHTVGSGRIRTGVPSGRLTLLTYGLAAPRLLKHLPHADRVQLACNMTPSTKVVDASGEVLAELTQGQGEAFALAQVHLSDRKPSPREPQPKSVVPGPVYFMSDVWLPALTKPVYRRGLQRIRK
jgi:predicted amidohydrolase